MQTLELYKRRETALILINIAVLAALFMVHIAFLFEIGRPSTILLLTLSIRFIILIFELLWVQKISPNTSSRKLKIYTNFSIWVNIIFAFIASVFGGVADSHYSVLMIIPIISAAFHFKLWQTLLIITLTVALTFLEIGIFFREKPPIDYGEFFEAATVSLIFLVVGLVVWLLVGYLREEELKLQKSLTELQGIQKKLVAEEKLAAVGQLASSIAHEIRNPVAMIASSLAMAEKQNSPIKEEMLGIATQEAKRLENLTSDFLAYARNNSPEPKKVKIIEVLEYVKSLIKAKAFEQNIELNILCHNELEAIIDSSQIQQALLNLLINALEATPAKGKITLGAEAENDYLKMFVENTGEKISERNSERIFEPFFTAKPKGTGLGLAIVRNIIHSHHGKIELAKNENGLVRFEIYLPNK
ncbi:MAG TPA: ATP-binding protein [Pyrinomonadaceae bacterium]|nr:ATP-binding protein [Pyrinomonadaceae bacterium]